MAYLITCSNSKRRSTVYNQSSLENLSFYDILHQSRIEIITLSGQILDWNYTLPAWELYSGRLHTRVNCANWAKQCADIKILSALFGWVKHTDLLPYYELTIDSKLSNGQRVNQFWLEKAVLDQIVLPGDIDLLFAKYRKAISRNGNIAALQPDVSFADNYGYNKGNWLNNELEAIICE